MAVKDNAVTDCEGQLGISDNVPVTPSEGVDREELKLKAQKEKVKELVECPICGKVFSNKYLRQHVQRVHEKMKRFTCNRCQKSFYAKSHLKRHIMCHIKCDFGSCKMYFKHRSDLTKHYDSHSVDRSFVCWCLRNATSATNLRNAWNNINKYFTETWRNLKSEFNKKSYPHFTFKLLIFILHPFQSFLFLLQHTPLVILFLLLLLQLVIKANMKQYCYNFSSLLHILILIWIQKILFLLLLFSSFVKFQEKGIFWWFKDGKREEVMLGLGY